MIFEYIILQLKNNSSVISEIKVQALLCQIIILSFLFVSEVNHAQSNESQSIPQRIVSIKIIDGNVVGKKTVRLTQGERVALHWITDKTLRIHLHGYDIEKVIKAGDDTVMYIEAYATGRFPITMHGDTQSHKHNHHGSEKTLIYLEVHPQ